VPRKSAPQNANAGSTIANEAKKSHRAHQRLEPATNAANDFSQHALPNGIAVPAAAVRLVGEPANTGNALRSD
jgi:hypothetical protein